MVPRITLASRLFKYNCIDAYIYHYIKYYLKCSKTKNKLLKSIRKIKLNKLGLRIGIEVDPCILDKSTIIYHQNIVINSNAKIGKNVKFHGNNCVGNNGKTLDAPVIGDNVDIGFGAVIIGGVNIPNNCKIGANAVVISSFNEEGLTIVGNPARAVESKKPKNSI